MRQPAKGCDANLSWRWVVVINVPVCAAALLLAVRLLPGIAAITLLPALLIRAR